jgi:hypothetical protein
VRLKLTDKVLGWHLRANFYPPIDLRLEKFVGEGEPCEN